MQADFAVELGADDETLELPWSDRASGLRYYDLKRNPEMLAKIEEAQREAALREFLSAINSGASLLESAKCDVWPSSEINPEEEIFGAAHKFGSYIDLLFAEEKDRFGLQQHEEFAKQLTALLKKCPEIPAAAEFLIRRCYYHPGDPVRAGFYFTFYLFGYGDEPPQAHQRWVIGLKLAENAIRQLSA